MKRKTRLVALIQCKYYVEKLFRFEAEADHRLRSEAERPTTASLATFSILFAYSDEQGPAMVTISKFLDGMCLLAWLSPSSLGRDL